MEHWEEKMRRELQQKEAALRRLTAEADSLRADNMRLRTAAGGEQGGEGWMRVPQGFVIAVNEFLADWQKGDFALSTLAALDVQSIIEAKERWADALAAGGGGKQMKQNDDLRVDPRS